MQRCWHVLFKASPSSETCKCKYKFKQTPLYIYIYVYIYIIYIDVHITHHNNKHNYIRTNILTNIVCTNCDCTQYFAVSKSIEQTQFGGGTYLLIHLISSSIGMSPSSLHRWNMDAQGWPGGRINSNLLRISDRQGTMSRKDRSQMSRTDSSLAGYSRILFATPKPPVKYQIWLNSSRMCGITISLYSNLISPDISKLASEIF